MAAKVTQMHFTPPQILRISQIHFLKQQNIK